MRRQDLGQFRFRAAMFAHQRKAVGGGEHDLGGPGLAVAKAVLAGLVEVDIVMDVLDGRDVRSRAR